MTEQGFGTKRESKPGHPPEFEIKDTTVITHLSSSPKGFEVTTAQSLMRREGLSVPYPQKDLNKANKREREYWKNRNLKEGKNVDPLIKDFRIIVGLRKITEKDNVLNLDIHPTTFVTFADDEAGLSKPENLQKSLEISGPIGLSIVILTTEKDGSHKIILQHRGTENRSYRDIPGASASGYFESKIYGLNSTRDKTGRLISIQTDTLIGGIYKEVEEEIGVDAEYVKGAKLIGVSTDLVRPHYEMSFSARTTLSSEEIVQEAKKKSQIERRPFDFSEDFLFVDGNPQAIETLLTKSKCPLAPGHIAAFFAVGYQMKLEEDGFVEAEKWKKNIENATQKNYGEINEIVKRTTDGKFQRYNPKLTPHEQGLPDFTSELIRVGLIVNQNDIIKTPEIMKTVDQMLIFDVDGVITNPQEKKITEPEILDEIIKRLEKGEPVALNTGRSASWMTEKVINPLLERVRDKTILKNFFAVGEKGGTWAEFDDGGNLKMSKDDNISVPNDLKEEIRNLIKNQYSDTMFYDESKLTMISTEMKNGQPLGTYTEKQRMLSSKFAELLADKNLSDRFKIDPTTIATDIENKFVGKNFAVRRIIDWVRGKGINPQRFVTFGDSFKSDVPMAQELDSQKLPVEFVYVGKDDVDTSAFPFVIHQTKSKFGKGTLEFLKSL